MKRILITGSSRGIGLEFVKQFLEKGSFVIASSRNPHKYEELKKLKNKFQENLNIIELDVSNEESRDKAFESISNQLDKLDLLINNAGVRFGGEKYSDALGKLHKEDFCKIFLVNSVAPLMMVEKFLPLLEKAEKPIVINISSSSGSITRRTRKGGGFSYSSSKAALNMITKALSVELSDSGIIVVSLHPGWVKTTMELTKNAPLKPSESIEGMIKVIESLKTEDTGKFIDWQGNEFPW
ncbi:MAG: SDR family oxidoreductase [Candidatus Heimdallarchaeota archaeon]|nr:SDR family oxidoreductase [Candidatus Heimdallarchaeota archaeon]MCK4955813.1 SDR family oxidoreductase [Candidatus Heimdallarchaeota archaeon]